MHILSTSWPGMPPIDAQTGSASPKISRGSPLHPATGDIAVGACNPFGAEVVTLQSRARIFWKIVANDSLAEEAGVHGCAADVSLAPIPALGAIDGCWTALLRNGCFKSSEEIVARVVLQTRCQSKMRWPKRAPFQKKPPRFRLSRTIEISRKDPLTART